MKQAFKFLRTLISLALPEVLLFSSSSAQAAVRVEGGLIKGVIEDGVTVYKGIPFAAPPTDDLRWKAPQPVVPWEDVIVVDKFGPACPQVAFPDTASIKNSVGTMSEDCLYLNVWTPAASSNEKLPVMVWIHGGGFAIGAPSIENYDGKNLAQKGVVFVSIAYRLGVLGFMAHPELSAENELSISGNYGLLDQIAGLKWVKNNISAFGGDPENVTIFGESAGGISVSMLCASPLAKGLFKRAISQSGGSFGPVREQRGNGVQTLKGAENQGVNFAQRMGAKSIAELRAMSPDKFLKDPEAANMAGFWPVCDGYVIVDDQYKLYTEGKYNDVDVIIGTNSKPAMFSVIQFLHGLHGPGRGCRKKQETQMYMYIISIKSSLLDGMVSLLQAPAMRMTLIMFLVTWIITIIFNIRVRTKNFHRSLWITGSTSQKPVTRTKKVYRNGRNSIMAIMTLST